MILHFKMIINNLLRKLFTKGKISFSGQNIDNLKKTSLLKNPVEFFYRKRRAFDFLK